MRARLGRPRVLVVSAAAVALSGGCSLLTSLDGYSGGSAAANEGGTTGSEASTDGRVPEIVAPDGGKAWVAAVLADRPIAYFPLEETSGTTAKDVIGGKDGTFVGTVKRGVPGAIGLGSAWDGASTRLELPLGTFAFPGHAPYSLEVWVNATTVDGQVRRVYNFARLGGNSGYGLDFAHQDDGHWTGTWRGDGDGGNDGYAAMPPLTQGKLTHLVATYDGALVRLYVDGVGSEAANGLLEQPNDGRLVFGDLVNGTYFKFEGLIDEIAIYDHALPPARVAAHLAAR